MVSYALNFHNHHKLWKDGEPYMNLINITFNEIIIVKVSEMVVINKAIETQATGALNFYFIMIQSFDETFRIFLQSICISNE